ncbi:unnamed protein product [Symbiodinium pilosum]|uniref:Uncharacterized protein n=1 Tax=Symbiodinium pilosum TaxID=2952 RepID=A0A812KHT7_SYMPI|nr:unnamed protein product [Symbiodinium pilosum]
MMQQVRRKSTLGFLCNPTGFALSSRPTGKCRHLGRPLQTTSSISRFESKCQQLSLKPPRRSQSWHLQRQRKMVWGVQACPGRSLQQLWMHRRLCSHHSTLQSPAKVMQ